LKNQQKIETVALVTGSNRGIGYTTVKELLSLGHTVILTSRKENDGQKAVSKLEKYGDLIYHQLDVSDPVSVEKIAKFIKDKFGRLDILINNAGINYDTWQKAVDANLEIVEETLNTNLYGAWRMAQAFIPLMKKNKYGRIVNVSSGSGAFAEMGSGTPAYSISKAALNVLTIKLANEVQNHGILVNSVCPGWVRTKMGGPTAPRSLEKGAETIVWAATLSDHGPTASFFRDKRKIEW
jgi:NAD(P)-dependent dehydrogenase (short-subunit alcohol dehydrogenase family)